MQNNWIHSSTQHGPFLPPFQLILVLSGVGTPQKRQRRHTGFFPAGGVVGGVKLLFLLSAGLVLGSGAWCSAESGLPSFADGGVVRFAFLPVEGWESSVPLGMRFGSGRRRCCRRRRILVPLPVFVSRWLMAVQCSRSMLEVVPGAESCSRSMSWSRARRRKEDCS